MARNYYHISFTNYTYTRLKVLIWGEDGLMYSTNLSKKSGDTLNEIYTTVEVNKPLIIDCKGVDGLIDHSWDLLFKAIGQMKRQIIFINYSPIEEKINYSHKEYCSNAIVEKDGKYFIIYYTTKTIEYSKAIEAEINSTLVANVNKYILSSFRKNDSDEMKLLMSTPFKANGEYDANLIISEPEKFIWTCVVFADFIEKKIIEYQIGSSLLQLKLLSVSLRSSPFAAAVAMLLNMNLMTIEHLGPVRKYFYTNSIMRTEHFEYLYIGDFSFAGTEIRMSKMYSALGGSVLNHVFVLGSLFNNERFEDFTLHALSDLNAINNSAQYALF